VANKLIEPEPIPKTSGTIVIPTGPDYPYPIIPDELVPYKLIEPNPIP
jgi:hypothetical protein